MLTLELIHTFKQALDRIKLCDQFLCRLGANSWYTGNVITGVAHQAKDVDDLIDPFDLPLVEHFWNTKNFELASLTAWFVDLNFFRHELVEVFVRCHHHHFLEPRFRRLTGQCSNNIVGFKTGATKDWNFHGLHQAVNEWDLLTDVFRQSVSLRLVFRILYMPMRWVRRVKGDCQMGWLLFLDQIEDRVGHAEHSGSAPAARSKSRAANECKVGAVNQRHTIE